MGDFIKAVVVGTGNLLRAVFPGAGPSREEERLQELLEDLRNGKAQSDDAIREIRDKMQEERKEYQQQISQLQYKGPSDEEIRLRAKLKQTKHENQQAYQRISEQNNKMENYLQQLQREQSQNQDKYCQKLEELNIQQAEQQSLAEQLNKLKIRADNEEQEKMKLQKQQEELEQRYAEEQSRRNEEIRQIKDQCTLERQQIEEIKIKYEIERIHREEEIELIRQTTEIERYTLEKRHKELEHKYEMEQQKRLEDIKQIEEREKEKLAKFERLELERREKEEARLRSVIFDEMKASPGGLEWEEVKMLGRGGFGEVFLWRHRENGEKRAVKKVRYGEEGKKLPEEVKQLQREIDILKILKHPNIVEYYKNAIINNYLVIIMEFVAGGSVHSLIDQIGALPERQAARYTKQTLQGLAYLHSNKIIHRDVKCANMLLGQGDAVKLCDFGTSKQLDHIYTATCSKLTANVGTMFYMAPEMFGDDGYSFPVDIWATGCSVVEMVTKCPPWNGYESQKLMFSIANGKLPSYKLPDSASQNIHSFVEICFCPDSKKRKTASEIIDHTFCMGESEFGESMPESTKM